MSYCPYCGREVSADMSFCPNCGAALSNEVRSYTLTEDVGVDGGDYKVYITGLGSAKKSDVIDLLEDVLGYTTTSARNLVNNIPVQIAGELSVKQAAVIAQAFEEYGVELSVTNGDEIEDISSQTSSASLFNSDGSFLASAAVILATLGTVNRLRSIVKPKKPSLLQRIFHSLFSVNRRRKPVHVRRSIRPRNLSYHHADPHRRTVRQQLRPIGNASFSSKPSSAGHNNKPGNSAFSQSHGSSHGGHGHQGGSGGHGGGHGHGGKK